MAASFVGAWTDFHSDNAGGSPIVITPTAGTIEPGDLLLFFALTRNSFPGTSPSGLGWIKRAEYDVNNSTIDTDLNQDDRFVLWSKVAGEAEPASYTLEITDNGTDGSLGHLVVFRGASFGGVEAAAGVTAPSVAGTEDGALVCFFGFAFDTNGSYTGPPAGMTLAAQEAAHSNSYPTGLSAYELLSSTGQTGTRAVGHTNVNTFSIAVSVALDPNTPPVVTITEPSDNDSFENGEEITFSATATDAEDGDISDDVVWISDIDGEIGTGATFATDALTHNKRHKITATVEDSDGQVGFDTIEITVGTPPTQWATDFEEYTPNEAPPDWSFQFGGASIFEIRDDATWGRHLRAQNVAAARTVYVWDEVGVARGRVQAFAILRRVAIDFAGVAVAVGGSSGSETCYAVLIGQTVDGGTKVRTRIRRYENGASEGDLVTFDAPHVGTSGYPYAFLIDYDPDTGIVRGKVWQPADPANPGADEPDWGLEYVDSSPLPAGRVGVFGSGTLLTDYFSAGAEGFPAPMPLGSGEPPTADTITAEQEGLRVRVTRIEPGTGGTTVILQRSTDAGETWVQIGDEYDPEITILYDDDPHVGSALYRTVLSSDGGATPSNEVEVVFDDEPNRPGTPTLTILGATLDTVLFETSGFFSPVGASGILAVAQVLDGDGEVIAEATRAIDADGDWLNAFVAGLTPPGATLTLRERHLDENGLYSHWSTPVPFTLETEEDEPVDPPEPPVPGSGGVVTALEFRSQWPGGTWGLHCQTFYPPELPIGAPDELGWPFLILTLKREGSQLATRRFTATSIGSEPNGWTREAFGKLRSNVEYVIDTYWTFGGLLRRKKTANRTIIFTTPRAPEAPHFRLPTVIHELTTVELYTDDFVGGVDGIELGTFTIEITFDGGQTWEILPDLREGASPGALLENLDTQDPASWSFPLDPSNWPKVTETRSPAQLRVTLTPAEEQAEIVSIINIENSHDPRVRMSPPFLIDPDKDCFDGPDDDLSAYTFGGSDGAAAEEARYSIVGEDGDKRIRRTSNGPTKTGGFAALSAAGLPRTFLVIGQTLISDDFAGDAWDQHWGKFIVDAFVYPGVGGYFDGDSYAALVGQRGTIVAAFRGWLGHFTETAGEGDTLLWWLNYRHGCANLGASRSISRFGPGGSPVSFAEIAGGNWDNSVDRFQQWVRNPWTAEPWYTHVLLVEALGNPDALSFSARVRYMMHGPSADRRAGWDYDHLVPEFQWPCGGVGYHTLDNLESILANVTEFRGLSVLPLFFGPCGEEPVEDEECESPWVDKPIPLCQGPWADKEIPEPGEPWVARIAATGDWTLREI